MLSQRRTKIVATIGPATCSYDNLKKCIESGLNVARLNFSHGDHVTHKSVIENIRKLSLELRAPVTVMQDLQGPKIRVGKFENDSMELTNGQDVVISPEFTIGKGNEIPSDFSELPKACKEGTRILLDDGLMELVVSKVEGQKVYAKVINGGTLKNRKGMNLPFVSLPVECLTKKDLEDLDFGIANNVDYIALSFVRRGEDIIKLRRIIESKGCKAKIIAKIEQNEALDNLEEIIALSDGVMVARGDLAIEIGQTRLPLVQKRIIMMANEFKKPVITATQMLDSMIDNPRPTRAEITDVANAVIDGSDALMLSAESASGSHPFKSIRTMHDIVVEVEKDDDYYYDISLDEKFVSVAESISASACLSALKLDADAIICLSTSGRTATLISSLRPKAKIIAITHIMETLNRLELVWGIKTFAIKPYSSAKDVFAQVEDILLEYGIVEPGKKVIMTLGLPVASGATTNSMRVYELRSDNIKKLTNAELPLRYQKEIQQKES